MITVDTNTAGCRTLLINCADAKPTDSILIVSDTTTYDVGRQLEEEARIVSAGVEHICIEPFAIHGQEPSRDVADKMLDVDIIFGLTAMSMAHSQARLKANSKGIKYFSLPDYSQSVLSGTALQTDFRALIDVAERIASILTDGNSVRVLTERGTDLKLNIAGRMANAAPGCCYGNVLLASPPDAEANIAPVEEDSNGVIVVDGSIPCKEIGVLHSPITLEILNGSVVNIEGNSKEVLGALFDGPRNNKSRIVAEFGMGLNPNAVLTGSMLEDEGALGTVHFGIGSNITIGGKNAVPFHLDHVIRDATVYVDERLVMERGVLKV